MLAGGKLRFLLKLRSGTVEPGRLTLLLLKRPATSRKWILDELTSCHKTQPSCTLRTRRKGLKVCLLASWLKDGFSCLWDRSAPHNLPSRTPRCFVFLSLLPLHPVLPFSFIKIPVFHSNATNDYSSSKIMSNARLLGDFLPVFT